MTAPSAVPAPHPPCGQPIPRGAPDAPFDLVLLDRDGTLNVQVVGDYVRRPEDLVILPGAARAVARLGQAGCRVVVVTNQRGVARGLMTLGDVDAVHERLRARLAEDGGHLDAILVCPHEAGECDCRKPRPGLVLEALRRAPWARPGRCLLVGDSDSDLEAAAAAGVPARRVGAGGSPPTVGTVVSEVLGPVR